jgi:hypothetical protein
MVEALLTGNPFRSVINTCGKVPKDYVLLAFVLVNSKVKRKAIPGTGRGGLQGCEMLRICFW